MSGIPETRVVTLKIWKGSCSSSSRSRKCRKSWPEGQSQLTCNWRIREKSCLCLKSSMNCCLMLCCCHQRLLLLLLLSCLIIRRRLTWCCCNCWGRNMDWQWRWRVHCVWGESRWQRPCWSCRPSWRRDCSTIMSMGMIPWRRTWCWWRMRWLHAMTTWEGRRWWRRRSRGYFLFFTTWQVPWSGVQSVTSN